MRNRYRYLIRDKGSFSLRAPVIDPIQHSVGWALTTNRAFLTLPQPIDLLRQHEINLLRFAIDPADLAEGIFNTLDERCREALATAIVKLYGPK